MSQLPTNLINKFVSYASEGDIARGGITSSVDTLTGNMISIRHSHAEIHDGSIFYVSDYQTGIGSGMHMSIFFNFYEI